MPPTPPRQNAPTEAPRMTDLIGYDPVQGYYLASVQADQNRLSAVVQGTAYGGAYPLAYLYANVLRPLAEIARPTVVEVVEYVKQTDVACGTVKAFVVAQHRADVRQQVEMECRTGRNSAEAARERLSSAGALPEGRPLSPRRVLMADGLLRAPEPFLRLPPRTYLRPPKAKPEPQNPDHVLIPTA